MIKQVLLVKNVGKLSHLTCPSRVELSGLTVIYAGNGLGKTTLSAILRSLQSGEAIHITERKTLGSAEPQQVVLATDQGNHTFSQGSWSDGFGRIEILDSAFVSLNVYEGRSVDHEHKKNLSRFVLGSEGVRLAQQVDRLDDEIRALNTSTTELESKISRCAIGSISVQEFVTLQTSDTIDADISRKEAQIDSLRRAGEIATREGLLCIGIPELPLPDLRGLLSTTLADVSQVAERRMREHISECMDERGERWLQQGMGYVKANTCPFCSGSLDGNRLFEAYRSFFDESYRRLKSDIQAFSETIENLLSRGRLLEIQGAISTNNTRIEFWKNHVTGDFPFLRVEDIGNSWQTAAQAIQEALKAKAGSPLEVMPESDELQVALAQYTATGKQVAQYNESVTAQNTRIQAKKDSTAAASVTQAQSELQLLQNRKKRGESVASNLCQAYSDLAKAKRSKEAEKVQARKDLTVKATSILNDYQKSINRHLSNCGAGFSIVDTKPSYQGGRTSTNYLLQINACKVDLARSKDDPEAAWFGNTLSDGDKNTLAFAFFLSKLENDADLARKVIVFDDPMTSLDRSRRNYTIKQVLDIAVRAEQVVVLTHDPFFARSLWKNDRGLNACMLQLQPGKDQITLCEFDIDAFTQSEYFRNYHALHNYVYDSSDARPEDVCRCIRPLLEGNLKFRFPVDFRSDHTLGSMIQKSRDASEKSHLSVLKPELDDLEELNSYSRRVHHGEREATITPIDEGELRNYAKKALDFVTANTRFGIASPAARRCHPRTGCLRGSPKR